MASNGYIEKYFYVRNAQGDIIEIINEEGASVCKYVYDTWGNVTSITGVYADSLAVENPFRYRGYYYDNESGLYYLQSRYYDPTTGRFLNADVFLDTGNSVLSANMFAYCENNAVNCVDPTGYDALLLIDRVGAVVLGYKAGHMAIMFEVKDRRGVLVWVYFSFNQKGKVDFQQMTSKNISSITDINNLIDGYPLNIKGVYDQYIRYSGDFSACYSYAANTGRYQPFWLTTNNCMHLSLYTLRQGPINENTRQLIYYIIKSGLSYPNTVFDWLLGLTTTKDPQKYILSFRINYKV